MCNVGFFDRFLRFFVGAVLFFFGLFAGNTLLLIIGAIPLATGIISFCPLYTVLGINTGCKRRG